MKLKYILISLGIASLTSCNSMLDVKPYSFSSDTNYYTNEGQILRAVNGVYAALQGLYTGDYWALTEMSSDNTNYQYDATDRGVQQREEIDEFLITSTNNYVNNSWATMYNVIQQTNVIITRIDQVPFADESLKKRYLGEVKFIRALQYFNLVRLFGEVPLHVTEVNSPEAAFPKVKASVDQVYAQIIADANDAINFLPVSYAGNDRGRVTQGAALTLLGEVYLTRKDYAQAVTNLDKVTKLGYTLAADYANNFKPTNKNGSESIFEIQFDAALQSEASNFIFAFGPRNAKTKLIGFPGNLGGSNIPTPSLYNAYETGDKRRDQSIQLFDDPSNAAFQESVAFEGKIPFIKKYYHPPFLEDGRANENWPVYRYSYVLLMLAEAKNEIAAGDGSALTLLNQVRSRAGVPALTGLSQVQFRAAVAKEQRIEVAFENHRWYQLLRTGTAMEVMNEHGTQEKKRLSRLSAASYNVQAHKLLFPIPAREVRLNGIEQNAGW